MSRFPFVLIVLLLCLPVPQTWAQEEAPSDTIDAAAVDTATTVDVTQRPALFVRVSDVSSTILQDMRYYGERNFVGRPVEGYEAPQCWLTRPAAEALAAVQADLQPFGLTLMVFDCYRPQRAVDHFVRWARDIRDTETKKAYYPNVPKGALFGEGYIASRSGHSRGSTVDLTLVPVGAPGHLGAGGCDELLPLGMGTGYDCFSPRSSTADTAVTAQARANRLLLKTMMERHGFRNYPKEWWHYTLRGEPFPETYFDFPVE